MSYDGTNFYGFQRQQNVRTVCNHLEEILSQILNKKTLITGCSRTDKKVHANNFYFHFETDKSLDLNKFKKSLNDLTSKEIFIKNIEKVNDDFHARYNVINKEYKYIINTGEYNPVERNICLEYNKEINIELIKEASNYLIGTHDFKSFTSDHEKENTVRTINYIKINKNEKYIEIYINADGFLKYMARNIIGLFLEINENKKQIQDIPKILQSKNRQNLGITAPPQGLYLNEVNYK